MLSLHFFRSSLEPGDMNELTPPLYYHGDTTRKVIKVLTVNFINISLITSAWMMHEEGMLSRPQGN